MRRIQTSLNWIRSAVRSRHWRHLALVLPIFFLIGMGVQGSPRYRLAYILLLDVQGLDPMYDPNRPDTALKLVMNEVIAKFGDSVAVRFRPLRDSAIACQNVRDARDCDAVIVRVGPYVMEPARRLAGSLEWMSGAKRHPTLVEKRPLPPLPPYRCWITTGLLRCRVSMVMPFVNALTLHFHSQAAGHMSP